MPLSEYIHTFFPSPHEGTKWDEESLHYVTPYSTADTLVNRLVYFSHPYDKNMVIYDLTGGLAGETLACCRNSAVAEVRAFERDPTRAEFFQHNVQHYGFSGKVKFLGELASLDNLKELDYQGGKLKLPENWSVIFDPPWETLDKKGNRTVVPEKINYNGELIPQVLNRLIKLGARSISVKLPVEYKLPPLEGPVMVFRNPVKKVLYLTVVAYREGDFPYHRYWYKAGSPAKLITSLKDEDDLESGEILSDMFTEPYRIRGTNLYQEFDSRVDSLEKKVRKVDDSHKRLEALRTYFKKYEERLPCPRIKEFLELVDKEESITTIFESHPSSGDLLTVALSRGIQYFASVPKVRTPEFQLLANVIADAPVVLLKENQTPRSEVDLVVINRPEDLKYQERTKKFLLLPKWVFPEVNMEDFSRFDIHDQNETYTLLSVVVGRAGRPPGWLKNIKTKVKEILGNFEDSAFIKKILDEKYDEIWTATFTTKSADPILNYEYQEMIGDRFANMELMNLIFRRFPNISNEEASIIQNNYASAATFNPLSKKFGFQHLIYTSVHTPINFKVMEDVFESFVGGLVTATEKAYNKGKAAEVVRKFIEFAFSGIEFKATKPIENRVKEIVDIFFTAAPNVTDRVWLRWSREVQLMNNPPTPEEIAKMISVSYRKPRSNQILDEDDLYDFYLDVVDLDSPELAIAKTKKLVREFCKTYGAFQPPETPVIGKNEKGFEISNVIYRAPMHVKHLFPDGILGSAEGEIVVSKLKAGEIALKVLTESGYDEESSFDFQNRKKYGVYYELFKTELARRKIVKTEVHSLDLGIQGQDLFQLIGIKADGTKVILTEKIDKNDQGVYEAYAAILTGERQE